MRRFPRRDEANEANATTGVLTNQLLLDLAVDNAASINYMIKRFGLDDQKADLLQEIHIAILDVDCSQKIDSPKTYVLAIARNIARAAYRQKKNRQSMENSFASESFEDCSNKLARDIAIRTAMEQDEIDYIAAMIEIVDTHLTAIESTVIKGYYLQGKNYEDLARDLRRTEGSLRQIKCRALKKLRLLAPR